jgi:hypothetical protein
MILAQAVQAVAVVVDKVLAFEAREQSSHRVSFIVIVCEQS